MFRYDGIVTLLDSEATGKESTYELGNVINNNGIQTLIDSSKPGYYAEEVPCGKSIIIKIQKISGKKVNGLLQLKYSLIDRGKVWYYLGNS